MRWRCCAAVLPAVACGQDRESGEGCYGRRAVNTSGSPVSPAALPERGRRWLRAAAQHIAVGDLPEGQRCQAVAEPLRQLLLLLKMIAYRAETAMLVAGPNGSDGKPLPRGLVQGLLKTPAHLAPDPKVGVLRVRLLHQSTAAADRRLGPLLDALNASRTVYPGTDLRLVYEFTA